MLFSLTNEVVSGGQELQGEGKFLSKLTCPYMTKSEVKMVGYWQCSFLRVHGPRRSRGLQTRKQGTRPISSHLDRTSLVNKALLCGLRGSFTCGTQPVVPTGQDSATLPARVTNHSAGFGSFLLLTELAI